MALHHVYFVKSSKEILGMGKFDHESCLFMLGMSQGMLALLGKFEVQKWQNQAYWEHCFKIDK